MACVGGFVSGVVGSPRANSNDGVGDGDGDGDLEGGAARDNTPDVADALKDLFLHIGEYARHRHPPVPSVEILEEALQIKFGSAPKASVDILRDIILEVQTLYGSHLSDVFTSPIVDRASCSCGNTETVPITEPVCSFSASQILELQRDFPDRTFSTLLKNVFFEQGQYTTCRKCFRRNKFQRTLSAETPIEAFVLAPLWDLEDLTLQYDVLKLVGNKMDLATVFLCKETLIYSCTTLVAMDNDKNYSIACGKATTGPWTVYGAFEPITKENWIELLNFLRAKNFCPTILCFQKSTEEHLEVPKAIYTMPTTTHTSAGIRHILQCLAKRKQRRRRHATDTSEVTPVEMLEETEVRTPNSSTECVGGVVEVLKKLLNDGVSTNALGAQQQSSDAISQQQRRELRIEKEKVRIRLQSFNGKISNSTFGDCATWLAEKLDLESELTLSQLLLACLLKERLVCYKPDTLDEELWRKLGAPEWYPPERIGTLISETPRLTAMVAIESYIEFMRENRQAHRLSLALMMCECKILRHDMADSPVAVSAVSLLKQIISENANVESAGANYHLGVLENQRENTSAAISYWRQAKSGGDPRSAFKLAQLIFAGESHASREVAARDNPVDLLSFACDRDYAPAMYQLGEILLDGGYRAGHTRFAVAYDWDRAMMLLHKSALILGFGPSQALLSKCYSIGWGILEDKDKYTHLERLRHSETT
ncbi:hypothetical protein Pelo_15079 [Pelomyxa schiedti]|nr:hypothetical protein Pelo_15079 [Pelomyxa schiedti]